MENGKKLSLKKCFPFRKLTKLIFFKSAIISNLSACFKHTLKYYLGRSILNLPNPFPCVRFRMGRHMVSLATRMKPIAISSTDISATPFDLMNSFTWDKNKALDTTYVHLWIFVKQLQNFTIGKFQVATLTSILTVWTGYMGFNL